jgi:hypothetical protein
MSPFLPYHSDKRSKKAMACMSALALCVLVLTACDQEKTKSIQNTQASSSAHSIDAAALDNPNDATYLLPPSNQETAPQDQLLLSQNAEIADETDMRLERIESFVTMMGRDFQMMRPLITRLHEAEAEITTLKDYISKIQAPAAPMNTGLINAVSETQSAKQTYAPSINTTSASNTNKAEATFQPQKETAEAYNIVPPKELHAAEPQLQIAHSEIQRNTAPVPVKSRTAAPPTLSEQDLEIPTPGSMAMGKSRRGSPFNLPKSYATIASENSEEEARKQRLHEEALEREAERKKKAAEKEQRREKLERASQTKPDNIVEDDKDNDTQDKNDTLENPESATKNSISSTENITTEEKPPSSSTNNAQDLESTTITASSKIDSIPSTYNNNHIPAGATSVNQLRMGEHGDKTRIVLETNKATPYRFDVDNIENILVVELPDAAWNTAKERRITQSPLVQSYNVQDMGNGTRLMFVLKEPIKIGYDGQIKAENGVPDRILFDLVKQ